MMLSHMPKNIEAGHRLHLDVGDHYLRANRVELLDGFWRGVEGENLMPLVTAKRYNHLHHRRLVIDNYDFCHTGRAENIAEMRKEKRK
jgi:hypothetical protein